MNKGKEVHEGTKVFRCEQDLATNIEYLGKKLPENDISLQRRNKWGKRGGLTEIYS